MVSHIHAGKNWISCTQKKEVFHASCMQVVSRIHAEYIWITRSKKGPTCNHADPWVSFCWFTKHEQIFWFSRIHEWYLVFSRILNEIVFTNSQTNISIFPNSRAIFRLFPNPERNRFPEFPNGKKANSRIPEPLGGGLMTCLLDKCTIALAWNMCLSI